MPKKKSSAHRQQKAPARPGLGRRIVKWTLSLALLAIFSMVAFDLQEVESPSMSPTLAPGDQLLVDRITPEFGAPSAGDVVLVRSPTNRKRELLVRVLGVEGDVVSYEGETLKVNDEVVDSPKGDFAQERPQDLTYTIPHGHIFVAGDNGPSAYDSRKFGPLPAADVVGYARWVVRAEDESRALWSGWLGPLL